ncbi:unnamed protein product [marine sediment metagenome]|uniref:Uncharacterized protein n=1 Tax=marine sediment metagenome TaxID=412755 RepID=X1M0I3_9ZZZZ
MSRRDGRKVISFQNSSGDVNNIVKFLEEVQKKINYLNLNCKVDGKVIKITLFGPKDLQYLASERLKELANQYL